MQATNDDDWKAVLRTALNMERRLRRREIALGVDQTPVSDPKTVKCYARFERLIARMSKRYDGRRRRGNPRKGNGSKGARDS